MPRTRHRRRWLWILLAVVLAGAAFGVLAWQGQRRAADRAARLLTQAASEVRELPEVPRWPLAEPASLHPDATPFPFAPDRPTLIVLLHGMSGSSELEPDVGTHAYARRYWGYHFVRALLGDRAPRPPNGEPLNATGWWDDPPDGADPRDALLVAADEGLRRAVLLVTRDGSRGLGEQVIAAAAQIDAGIAHYRAWLADTAGVAADDPEAGRFEPQLVLIGHSFGGVVGRYLLTNPPLDGGPFGTDADTRARADDIRDRTLFLVTLGTPHEGSAAADRAMLLAAAHRALREEIAQEGALARRWLLPLLDQGATLLRLEDPVTEHLRTDVWAALNEPEGGLLAAHRARRGDGTPVPVYALAARTPGGHFFVDPLVSDRIELELAAWYAERLDLPPAFYREFLLQMLLADPTMHALAAPERGWGRAVDHPAPAGVLDRVTRVPTEPERVVFGPPEARVVVTFAARVDFLRGPYAGEIETRSWPSRMWCLVVRCGDEPGVIDVGSIDDLDLSDVEAPTVAVVRDLLLGREPPGEAPPLGQAAGRIGDGEIDSDGVVPVDSALGYVLGRSLGEGEGPYLAAGRTWTIGGDEFAGSWYRPDLTDAEATLPWTYLHHVDLQWEPAVAAWIAERLLDVAGPDPGDMDVSGWR